RVAFFDPDAELLHRLVAFRPGLRGEDEAGTKGGQLLEVRAHRVGELQHRDLAHLGREAFAAAERLADRDRGDVELGEGVGGDATVALLRARAERGEEGDQQGDGGDGRGERREPAAAHAGTRESITV